MEHRLTTILAADVVRYCRLMDVDEVGVLTVIKFGREAMIGPKISEHNGRILKQGEGM